jgi:16S rRNA G966 N2-methylase RsmD
MLTNKLKKRIFPYIKNIDKIEIDNESLNYISIKDDATYITFLIKKYFDENSTIIDAMSGVGGNTISFSKNFKKVYAIELNQKRYDMLCNNINVYELKNVETYNDNCLNKIFNINSDIIFFDPPWGGKDYKNHDKLRLTISNVPLEDICIKLKNKNIVLKLPKNYDIEFFKNKLNLEKLNIEILNKMLIIIL